MSFGDFYNVWNNYIMIHFDERETILEIIQFNYLLPFLVQMCNFEWVQLDQTWLHLFLP